MSSAASMPSCSLRLEVRQGQALIWPDDQPRPAREWFEPAALADTGRSMAGGTGRGATVRFEADGRHMILRHYRRGGFVSRFVEDRFLRTGLWRSRPWRELAILTRLAAGAMPVPPPVGARMVPAGAFSPWYRADLITGYLASTRTLAQALRTGDVDDSTWPTVGATIARFHAVGVDHADLNAHNVLIDDRGQVYLIDFDRARLRWPGRWRQRNLARLRRSLDKLQAAEPALGFTDGAWHRLLAGYRSL